METNSNAQNNIFNSVTVPTEYVDVKDTKFAYRSFGKKQGVPLIFLQHFTGTMDNWDSAIFK